MKRRRFIAAATLCSLAGCAKAAVKGADEVADGAKAAKRADDAARRGDDVADHGADAAGNADKVVDSDGNSNSRGGAGGGVVARADPETEVSWGDLGSDSTVTYVDDQYIVEDGGYLSWDLNYSSITNGDTTAVELEYTASVSSGEDIDIILIPADEYLSYTLGGTVDMYSQASRLAVQYATADVVLAPDDYKFIIDNTDSGEATPQGPVWIDIEMTGTRS
jgi:hypothetical protein